MRATARPAPKASTVRYQGSPLGRLQALPTGKYGSVAGASTAAAACTFGFEQWGCVTGSSSFDHERPLSTALLPTECPSSRHVQVLRCTVLCLLWFQVSSSHRHVVSMLQRCPYIQPQLRRLTQPTGLHCCCRHLHRGRCHHSEWRNVLLGGTEIGGHTLSAPRLATSVTFRKGW